MTSFVFAFKLTSMYICTNSWKIFLLNDFTYLVKEKYNSRDQTYIVCLTLLKCQIVIKRNLLTEWTHLSGWFPRHLLQFLPFLKSSVQLPPVIFGHGLWTSLSQSWVALWEFVFVFLKVVSFSSCLLRQSKMPSFLLPLLICCPDPGHWTFPSSGVASFHRVLFLHCLKSSLLSQNEVPMQIAVSSTQEL